MGGVNKVILIGTLGKDPEVRTTPGGKTVVNFSIATSDKYKDNAGVQQEKTEWHRLVVWGKLGELIGRELKKGQKAYFEGKLQTRDWEDKENNNIKRYATEIVVNRMDFIEKKEGGQGVSQPPQSSQNPVVDESDLPF